MTTLYKDAPDCGYRSTITARFEHEARSLIKQGWTVLPAVVVVPTADVPVEALVVDDTAGEAGGVEPTRSRGRRRKADRV